MSQKQHLFFEFARTGKRLTAAWFAVPIGLISTVAGQIVGGIGIGILVVMAMFGNGGTDDPEAAAAEVEASLDLASLSSVEQGLFLIGFFFFAAIAIFLWVRLFEKRSIASMGFHGLGSGLFKFARGGLFAFLSMAAMAFGMQAIGYAEGSPAEVPTSWMLVWPLLILMLGWIVQGSTEEIVTRGLLFQSVGARHGLIVAVIISAAVFTLLHGMNDNPSAVFFINLALYSVFACFYALREASLWGICGHHAMWNFTQGNLFGFAVSGSQFGEDRLMQFSETGPDLITGGATGPEGGLVTTIILAISMVVLLLIKPSKDLYDKVPAPSASDGDACPID